MLFFVMSLSSMDPYLQKVLKLLPIIMFPLSNIK